MLHILRLISENISYDRSDAMDCGFAVQAPAQAVFLYIEIT